jgi:hypothetical protein
MDVLGDHIISLWQAHGGRPEGDAGHAAVRTLSKNATKRLAQQVVSRRHQRITEPALYAGQEGLTKGFSEDREHIGRTT